MHEPLPILTETSVQIAWDYLDRTGDLGNPEIASRFLSYAVEQMIQRGERRRLMLSNRRSIPTRGTGSNAAWPQRDGRNSGAVEGGGS